MNRRQFLKQLKKVDDKEQTENRECKAGTGPTHREVFVQNNVRVDLSDNLEQKYATYDRDDRTYKRKQLFWARFSIFLITVYAVVTLLIYCETQKAANAARDSANATKQALVASNRSWIEFTIDQSLENVSVDQIREKMEKVSIPVQCTNIGNMPAKNINIRTGLEILDADKSPVFPFIPGMRITSEFIPILYPHRVDKFNAMKPISQTEPVSDAEPMSPILKKEFELGSKYAAVVTDGTFTDQFGDHWFRYCKAVYLSKNIRGYPTRNCSDYNDTGDGPLPKQP